MIMSTNQISSDHQKIFHFNIGGFTDMSCVTYEFCMILMFPSNNGHNKGHLIGLICYKTNIQDIRT